jgi:hypothetical protein
MENKRFGLVFAKTGSINSGTWQICKSFKDFLLTFIVSNSGGFSIVSLAKLTFLQIYYEGV